MLAQFDARIRNERVDNSEFTALLSRSVVQPLQPPHVGANLHGGVSFIADLPHSFRQREGPFHGQIEPDA